MTGDDLLKLILSDSEICGVIQSNESFRRPPVQRKRRTRISTAKQVFQKLWSGYERVQIILILEKRLGPSLAIAVLSGRSARIQSAMILAIDALLREET